jgi:pyruvate formate lyase activating enzyme
MDLEIKGIIPTTMLDWEGKLATTLFVGGCNFRCPWCQNPDLVLRPQEMATVGWEHIKKHLQAKRDWLDGVVVTGGEPTIHGWLPEALGRIKSLGYPVKLDTNGSQPGALRILMQRHLVDCVAMDIKTSFAKYAEACGVWVDTNAIRESINLILDSGIDHEFRTTVVPGYVEEADILEIAGYIPGAKRYLLQQFSPKKTLAAEMSKVHPYDGRFLQAMASQAGEITTCALRG